MPSEHRRSRRHPLRAHLRGHLGPHVGATGRHARIPKPGRGPRADGEIKAPGLAAMMRRNPDAVRKSASAAIAGGIALFVVASVTNAGAAPSRPKAAPGAAAPAYTAPLNLYAPYLDAPAIDATTGATAPKVAVRPAPVDPAAISGLAANGIPTVALNAYRVAAARMGNADPSCGIDWALLAGIGREESDHGQFAGAVLHADGVSTPRIIGIALNGQGTALILDTDHGRLDGDTVYDHAVGPMQFIPSTWAIYGTDANGDGVADPFNINDAALTAARYLCAAGGDLRTHDGQVRAVLAYNNSAQYLAQVLALADAYRRGIPISGIPVGNLTGGLAPLDTAGTPPPANPGPPTANSAGSAKSAPAAGKAPTRSTAGGSTTTSPAGNGTPSSSGSPSSGGSGGSTSGSPGTSAPAPSPSPSTTKCALPDLLNPGKCAIKG